MHKKDKIVIEVPLDTIKKAFGKVINSENAPIIVDAIVKHLQETDLGLEDLYFSLMGVERTFKYKVLDKVWVNIEHLPSWRIDKVKSEAAGLILREKFIKCTVVEIQPLVRSCYRVEFEAIPTGKDEPKLEEYMLAEYSLHSSYDEEEDLLPF